MFHAPVLLAILHSLATAATVDSAGQIGRMQPAAGRFLQITDIHFDPYYYDEGEDRDKMTCHQLIASPPGDGNSNRFPIGKRRCDSSPLFVNRTLDHLRDRISDAPIDFIVWTGDTARHDIDPNRPRTLSDVRESNQLLTGLLSDLVASPSRIVPVIGNNDVASSVVNNSNLPEVLQVLADTWKPLFQSPSTYRHRSDIDAAANENLFRNTGFFKKRISSSLSVISVNTLLFHHPNWDFNDCRDPNSRGYRHLYWLEEQLEALDDRKSGNNRLKGKQQRVILAGHIAPSRSLYTDSCRDRYIRLSLEYRHMIIGHLFGHTNFDYVNLLADDDGEPAGVFFTSSSVVPVMNPSFRFYDYDANTNDLIDYQHYVALIDQTDQQRPVNYRFTYSYREMYGVPDLSPRSVNQVRGSFSKNVYLWKDHLRRMVVFHPYWLEQIDTMPLGENEKLSFQSNEMPVARRRRSRPRRQQDDKFWLRLRDLYCDLETGSARKFEQCLRLFIQMT